VSERLRTALTFDAEHPDRPNASAGGAERILDVLEDAGARATFFLQSRWAMANPDLARRIADAGHLVGNHSTYHARMTLFSDDGIRVDVRQAGDTIAELAGVHPRPWFRCPFGDGHDDRRVLDVLEELGYRSVHWHVESEDWEPWRTPAEIGRASVEGAIAHGDGAVVLLHTWPRATAAALPIALEGLERAMASLVTIDELEDLP
jgi:peptidoglycan/xylan/chitin deacetylase (PgdA/CDA1 family)